MRTQSIGVNTPSQNPNKQSFKARTFRPEHVFSDERRAITLQVNRLVESDSRNVSKLKRALKAALKIVNTSESHVLGEHDFIKRRPTLTKWLRSNDLGKQKRVVEEIFGLDNKPMHSGQIPYAESYLYKYAHGVVIPHVQKTGNVELANLIKLKTARSPQEHSAGTLVERIKILEALGTKQDIAELATYVGKQEGISKTVAENLWYVRTDEVKINQDALRLMEKIMNK